MNKLKIISAFFLLTTLAVGCATNSLVKLNDNQYIAIANDSKGLPSAEDSLENATILAKNKCGDKEVVVDNVINRNDSYNYPETSLTFHCK